MSQYLVDQIAQTPNIEVRTNARVAAAHGDEHLDRRDDRRYGNRRTSETVPAASLFIFIGAEPRTDWLGRRRRAGRARLHR